MLDFNYDQDLGIILNGAVWDISQGTILKLGDNKEITHALRGFELLTRD